MASLEQLEARITKLEEEVRQLKRTIADPSRMSPSYQMPSPYAPVIPVSPYGGPQITGLRP